MNRDQILINAVWVEGKLNVFSRCLDQNVTIFIQNSPKALRFHDDPMSDKLVQTINDFLELPVDQKSKIQVLLYQHCLSCCEVTSYGFDVESGETETEANLRNFEVANEDDAFKVARSPRISIYDDESLNNNRFVHITFYPDWENEHGCEFLLKNGVLLDFCGDAGSSILQFDFED